MPYVRRTVTTGKTVEHRKMQSFRVHTKGVRRNPHKGTTSQKQTLINERVAEENLRWLLNGNFGYGDLHNVLHYGDKTRTLEQCKLDLKLFLKKLRLLCKKSGLSLRYICVTETKRMTNIHHHVITNKLPIDLIAEAWESIEGESGISLRPMDKRGNHYKLASYLVKEGRSTMAHFAALGIKAKRYSASQNLAKPEVTYTVVSASSWREEPKARKGAMLVKFDDGATHRSGWHEESGYPWQEYFELFG